MAGDYLPRRYAAGAAALPLRPRDGQGRLGADGPCRGRRPRCASGDGARGRDEDEVLAATAHGAAKCPSARSCSSASRASPTRPAPRRASTRPGPTPTARRGRLGGADERDRGARRGPGRALRAGVPRPDPGPPRARPPTSSAERQPRGRRRRGGSNALDQLVFRPVPSLSPYRTPVRGLYLGSAATFPGGAVHGVPGHAAARLALAEARLRRA